MKKILNLWDRFWFSPLDLLPLALMRIVLCGTLFCLYVVRSFNLEYFTDASWIPRSKALLVMNEVLRPPFLWAFWPDSLNPVMHGLLVVLLLLLTLGIGGRWIMFIAWVIDLAFVQRNYGVNYGADIIGSIFLFYMSFTQSCERLSVLNLWRKKTEFKKSDIISSTFIRMMQVQICVVYAYTGFEKLRGASWWDGTALWSVLANPQMMMADFTFLRSVPWVIPIIGFTTILFEIYFPAMMLWKRIRPYWLLIGVAFHLGIGFSMGIMPFSTIMMSTYFLFLSPLVLEQKIVSKLDFAKN